MPPEVHILNVWSLETDYSQGGGQVPCLSRSDLGSKCVTEGGLWRIQISRQPRRPFVLPAASGSIHRALSYHVCLYAVMRIMDETSETGSNSPIKCFFLIIVMLSLHCKRAQAKTFSDRSELGRSDQFLYPII